MISMSDKSVRKNVVKTVAVGISSDCEHVLMSVIVVGTFFSKG